MNLNIRATLDEPLKSPSLQGVRRRLEKALRQTLDEWNSIIPLPQRESTDRFVHQILRFMECAAHAISPIKQGRSIVTCQCLRWQPKDTLGETTTLMKLVLTDGTVQSAGEILCSKSSPEYDVLVTGSNYCNEKDLFLRAWLPDLESKEEAILLFRFHTDEWVLTPEIGSSVETSCEALLSGIRLARYLAEKSKFVTCALRNLADEGMLNASEMLLYHEIWRSSWQIAKANGQKDHIRLDHWVKSSTESILLDSPDQDYILASYLASLMYLAHQGSEDARKRLENVLSRIPDDEVFIGISRGPMVVAGPAMERSLSIIAQARSKFSPRGLPDKERNKLRKGLEKVSGLSDAQKAGYLKALWSIVEHDAISLKKSELSSGERLAKLEKVVKDARDIAGKMKHLLIKAIRSSVTCIELSSRWLDAWFGLRLLESQVLPLKNLENYEPVRIAELVSHWARYFRYLLDYFVLRQLPLDEVGLLDLPTEPAGDMVEQAQLNLICEWAHVRGVPRTIPLQAWLSKTYETELALYSLSGKGSYRQHIFHVQDTCLLGCAILFGHWREGDTSRTLLKIFSESSGQAETTLLCNWLVASLLHDIGYGFQVVPLGLEALPDGVANGLDELVKDIKHRLKQKPSAVADYDPTASRTSGKLEISDHAQVSMTAVLTQLRSLSDKWQTASTYNPALAAIIDHGSKDTPIDYSSDPLSALIVICDQLQDWGRVRLDTTLLASSFLSNMHMSPEREPDLVVLKRLFSPSRLYIKIDDFDTECNFINHNTADGKHVMEFLVHGPFAGGGGYEPATAWLDICRAFQRICLLKVDSDSSLPEIHIILQHGVADNEIPELHRLDRFAHENEEQRGVILDWLNRVRKQEIIRYGCSHNPHRITPVNLLPDALKYTCYEWIEYPVPDLNDRGDRPLKSLPDKLYKSYREFRKKEAVRKQ